MNPFNLKIKFILVLFVLTLGISPMKAEDSNPATATLPLKDVIDLYLEKQKSNKSEDAKDRGEMVSPVPALINKFEIKGQLLENAVEMKTNIQVSVLNEKDWVTVPLFKLDKTLSISSLPEITNGYLIKKNGALTFITKDAGVYSFSLSLIKRVNKTNKIKTVKFHIYESVKAKLNLNYDEDSFRLLNESGGRSVSGVSVYPIDNVFSINWKQNKKVKTFSKKKYNRPPVESIIKSVHVSSVSTLEGKLINRILYDLKFEGTKPIVFSIPKHYNTEKVYLNGAAIPFKIKNGKINVEALPKRTGVQSGKVELVLTRDFGNYLLSGSLNLDLPGVSWTVQEMYLDIYLPDVFNYTRAGGSMEAIDTSPDVNYTYSVPVPGKRYTFHQYLITETNPTVRLDYAIDLRNNYFVIK